MTGHVDMLIVGAGLSGIGAAVRLRAAHPHRSYTILEARDDLGGTWDLFRYPGVRSDSDMFTLSYPFRPWRGRESMGAGAEIKRYIADTAAEYHINSHIRYGARVVAARWSSPDARWTVELADGSGMTCAFLYSCAGYYSYDRAWSPDFPGLSSFTGTVVHPQFWPEDLDHRGRRIVVIGSGATAVTLLPALAGDAAHVTMLQRSPSYLAGLPVRDAFADAAHRILPPGPAHRVARARSVLVTQASYLLSRRLPGCAKKILRRYAVHALGDEAYVDEHFTPAYNPWDQRLCVTRAGDFFAAVRSGRAGVVTGHIDTFVPEGIRLRDGRVLPADLVITATGLSLQPFGGIRLSVDGVGVRAGERRAYRGMMLSGVPNFAFCFGYANASWTLRADLVHRYLCRLLAHLDRTGARVATPGEPRGPGRPLLGLTSGYLQRSMSEFPRQGDRHPWLLGQNYLRDAVTMPRADVSADMTFRS